jgi:hypothetical protein
MLRTIALLGLGAAVAITSLPAIAQTTHSAAPTGLHNSQMRHRDNMSKERAKVSAHHFRHLRPKTVTP